MTASEKLQQLVENDKLTDEQQENLNDWGILTVAELEDYLIDKIKELQFDTYSVNYDFTITALYELLNYSNDDYIAYDENGVQELDFDTLNDALDVDQKRRN